MMIVELERVSKQIGATLGELMKLRQAPYAATKH